MVKEYIKVQYGVLMVLEGRVLPVMGGAGSIRLCPPPPPDLVRSDREQTLRSAEAGSCWSDCCCCMTCWVPAAGWCWVAYVFWLWWCC